ncbi:hypothetical protein ACFZBU_35615 [Embleya sp. NPDC008237]|uniref:hypothetical protein n=1 Tax=Embleya sp. NPDC008237 TaxID=3363978 RepID=UPI0036F0097E
MGTAARVLLQLPALAHQVQATGPGPIDQLSDQPLVHRRESRGIEAIHRVLQGF